MRGLLCEVSSLLYDKPTCEATTFVYRIISNKGGNKMAANKKPTHTLHCGNIKATIWLNASEKGPFRYGYRRITAELRRRSWW